METTREAINTEGSKRILLLEAHLHSVVSKIKHPKSKNEDNCGYCTSTFKCAAVARVNKVSYVIVN